MDRNMTFTVEFNLNGEAVRVLVDGKEVRYIPLAEVPLNGVNEIIPTGEIIMTNPSCYWHHPNCVYYKIC